MHERKVTLGRHSIETLLIGIVRSVHLHRLPHQLIHCEVLPTLELSDIGHLGDPRCHYFVMELPSSNEMLIRIGGLDEELPRIRVVLNGFVYHHMVAWAHGDVWVAQGAEVVQVPRLLALFLGHRLCADTICRGKLLLASLLLRGLVRLALGLRRVKDGALSTILMPFLISRLVLRPVTLSVGVLLLGGGNRFAL